LRHTEQAAPGAHGVIGRRTEGMTPTAVDEIEILRLFGVRLIHYGLDELLERAELVSRDEASESWLRFSSLIPVLAKTEHGLQTARNYLACKQIITQQGLSALTIGSYPNARERCASRFPG